MTGMAVDKRQFSNHDKGSVLNAINAFEPSIEGETAIVPRETQQSYPPAWQSSATCRKTGQDILGNAEMGGLTQPTLLFRRCSFPLPFVSIDGTMAWLISISALIKKSKNGSIRGSPQKTHRFFEMVYVKCLKDGKK